MNNAFYDFKVKAIDGEEKAISEYKGKVLLIVNTASKCGYTPQFEGLQKLFESYGTKGFTVLGFPCNQFSNQDPGSDESIRSFCTLNYGVTFPMFSKIDVNGADTHPLYKYLKSKSKGFLSSEIKWNFTKFLVDRKGIVVKRFSPATKPDKIEKFIKKFLEG